VVDHLQNLTRDRELLATLAGSDLTSDVDACPGWSLHDLLVHLSMVHRFAVHMMAIPPDGQLSRPTEHAPDGDSIWEFLDVGLERLITDLGRRNLDDACLSFVGPVTVGWWLRRQSLETTVHRWDAEMAAGRQPAPIGAATARDGIDEWLDLLPRRGFAPHDTLRGTLHLHATDDNIDDGEWFVEIANPVTWRRGHEKGDVAVRGSCEQLYLACWGRVAPTSVEVIGDTELFTAFLDSLGAPPR
jgi:uncharacterized protein (TIGR03083 family)